VFTAAAALGKGSLGLLLLAVVVFLLALAVVYLWSLWSSNRPRTRLSHAKVVESSVPPAPGPIAGRVDMRLLIDFADGAKMINWSERRAPTLSWPWPGSVLTIEVDQRNRKLIRVRWDRTSPTQPTPVTEDPGYSATSEYIPSSRQDPALVAPSRPDPAYVDPDYLDPDYAAPSGPDRDYAAPFHTEFADEPVPDLDYAPTPTWIAPTPRPHADGPADAPAETPADADPTYRPAEFLDPAMDFVDGEPTKPGIVQEDLTLDEIDVDPWPTNRLPADPPAAPEPSLGDEHARAADYELPVRGIPLPRPSEPAVERPATDNGAMRPGMGITLGVSDLARSLAFYRDTLSFEVIDSGPSGAVLAYGGGRLLLRPRSDMSPADRRAINLHIEVPDVEAAYQELRAKGVEFAHKPRVLSRGDKLELWAARFFDPDGYGIALTQWRDRQDVSHG
jgi:catechol 2,3-dioxygenase-like lactoylglutathione lyase family enzyme